MTTVRFNNATFILGATTPVSFIKSELKEVAIVGRSNVGKSSLINMLTGHTKLAKVSNTPGRTQQVNYFNINNNFLLVDLPGYGYAKLSKTDYKKINDLIKAYLKKSKNLKLVLLVIDIRHELKNSDLEMIKTLSKMEINIKIILNKGDKKHTQEEYWQKQINKLQKQYSNIIVTANELPIKQNDPQSLENIKNAICSYIN